MNQLNVLVIDDDAPCLVAPLTILLETTALLTLATNEEEMWQGLEEKPDVILMDGSLLGWREGFDRGTDVVQVLRSQGLTTPIIMFSSDQKMNEAGLAAGATAVWGKEHLFDQSDRGRNLVTFLQSYRVPQRPGPSAETLADLARFAKEGCFKQ